MTAKLAIDMIRYFEKQIYDAVESSEISLKGNTVTENSSVIGTDSTAQTFENDAAALEAFEQKCAKKTSEGFVRKTYPFPFFGAGNAAYFEWAEVTVVFAQKPDDAQIRRIIESAPEPIKPTKKDFTGRTLGAGSEQFVNMHIQWAYGEDGTDGDDAEDPCFYVTPEALDAFNAHLEAWLLDIHAFCPIVCAYRGEDGEAGGTQLSAWHRMSLEAIPGLLQNWANDPAMRQQSKKEKELFGYCLEGIFYYGEIDLESVPESFAEAFFPEAKLRRLLGVTSTAERLDVAKITYKAVEADNQPLLEKLIPVLSNQSKSCEYIYEIGSFANELGHTKKKYADSRRMFDIALQIEPPAPCGGIHSTLTVYNNALWVLQNDNTGLPVDAGLNERFLAKCLPYAPKNPSIFYNAACLYVEMNDFDKAVDCIKQTIVHKFDSIRLMKEQIANDKMFAEFRKYPPLAEVMENM